MSKQNIENIFNLFQMIHNKDLYITFLILYNRSTALEASNYRNNFRKGL